MDPNMRARDKYERCLVELQTAEDDIKMHSDWCKKFVKGINWQGGSGRCPLCRRIHADLTPLQNLHAHAHCRLDTIADLTLGRLFPKQANALLVSALYSG